MDQRFPILNLVVIRSRNMDRAVQFYETLGLVFEKHAHGNGPEHYAAETGGAVFEIYPEKSAGATTAVRLGFRVNDVDDTVQKIQELGLPVTLSPVDSQWGRRAVVQDFDGHKIELLTNA